MTTAGKGSDFKSDQDTFDQIVSQWRKSVPCRGKTKSGRCRRPAVWRVNLHGCNSTLMCGHHYWAWHRENLDNNRCPLCKTRFPDFFAAFTAVRL